MDGLATPGWLWLLAVIAALAAGYIWVQQRQRHYHLRFANLELLDRIARRPSRLRRYGAPVLLALGLIVVTIGLAGPTANARVPASRSTVMLVIDVSLSMQSTDISPTRLTAAETAATHFVQQLPPGVSLGVESFAAVPILLAAPSTDRGNAIAALHELRLAESTNTGGALQTALATLHTFDTGILSTAQGLPPARIVLESDGKQTTGPSDIPIAAQAGRAHVPIDTISIGTPDGTVTIDGQTTPVPVDDQALAQIAQLSGGRFFTAHSADATQTVYNTLGRQIGYQTERVDDSKPWFTAGTLTILAAIALAVAVNQRLPA